MKKITLLFVALSAIGFSACKKDRTCACTITSTEPNTTSSVVNINIVDAKKSDAKNFCVKTTEQIGGYTLTQDCQLN